MHSFRSPFLANVNLLAGGVKHKRRSQVYSDFGPIDGYISQTLQDRR